LQRNQTEYVSRLRCVAIAFFCIESKLADRYGDLGHRCYELHLKEQVWVFDDEKATALCQEITDMLAELKNNKWELEKMQADDSNQ